MYVRKIQTALLSLRVGGGSTTLFPNKGLKESGPLVIRNPNLSLKVVHGAKDRANVEKLLKEIKRELYNVFRVRIEKESSEEVANGADEEVVGKIMSLSREDARQSEDQRPIYLVIIEKGLKSDPESTYYRIKKELLSNGILSQIVTRDTLKDQSKMTETTFRNIALGIFVKMGNVPWHLQMPVTLSGESEETLIIGIGITSIREDVFSKGAYRYAGYFSFYNSRGVWKTLSPLFSSIEKVQQMIRQYLIDGIEQTISSEKVNELDVIIHYSGKDVKRGEEEVIHNTLAQYAEDKGIRVNYALVRLIKSPAYRLFSNHEIGYAPMGAYVDLENNLVLINTTGLLGTKYIPMGVNTPILASIRKTKPEVDPNLVHNIVYSIVGLARMNWRGVNPFNFEPATTRYAREIAYTIAKLGEKIYQDEIALKFLQRKMWFI